MTDDPDQWLAHGIARGWITAPYCDTHDVAPEPYDGFDDVCVFAVVLTWFES